MPIFETILNHKIDPTYQKFTVETINHDLDNFKSLIPNLDHLLNYSDNKKEKIKDILSRISKFYQEIQQMIIVIVVFLVLK